MMNGDFDAVNFLFIMKPRCVIDVFLLLCGAFLYGESVVY